jgi:hypothetical protein
MTVEIDYAEAKFRHDDRLYLAIGGVTHNTKAEHVGIGSYEYWGCREYDTKVVAVSEFKDAEFIDVCIYPDGDTSPLGDPSDALVTAAEEALFDKTYERAEQQAAEEE